VPFQTIKTGLRLQKVVLILSRHLHRDLTFHLLMAYISK